MAFKDYVKTRVMRPKKTEMCEFHLWFYKWLDFSVSALPSAIWRLLDLVKLLPMCGNTCSSLCGKYLQSFESPLTLYTVNTTNIHSYAFCCFSLLQSQVVLRIAEIITYDCYDMIWYTVVSILTLSPFPFILSVIFNICFLSDLSSILGVGNSLFKDSLKCIQSHGIM